MRLRQQYDIELGPSLAVLLWYPYGFYNLFCYLGSSYHNVSVIPGIPHEQLNLRLFDVTEFIDCIIQDEFQSSATTFIKVVAEDNLSTPTKSVTEFSKNM